MREDWTVAVTPEDRLDFGKRPIISQHNLHESRHFADADIIQLLSEYPRDRMRV